jgi:cytochrome c553
LQRSVEREFEWEAVPRQRPQLARGARLYAQSCAACHGAAGRPPAGNPLQLSTPAASFIDPDPADGLSPRRIFDAVTWGIPESAMPSFDEALSDQDRWSIAFYVQALRHARPETSVGSPLSLEDAALASDALLRAQLEAGGTTPSEIESALAQVRWNPPRRHGSTRLALVLPDWLVPVSLREEVMESEGARIDLVLRRPGRAAQAKLLFLVNLIARQAFLRAATPLTGLAVNLWESDGALEPVARCTLVNLKHVQCGVAPPERFSR